MEASHSKGIEGDIVHVDEDGDGGVGPLQDERRKLSEEFNVQRAKMRDLFLQKEEELRSMANEKEQMQSEMMGLRTEVEQLRTLSENQKSEMQSLQLLISETVEASTSGADELRRLQTRNLELEHQLNLLSKQAAQQEMLAPAALVRNLARKFGADTDNEDAARKAQEDAELLRSLVEPLEEEIKALKDKLRETDSQLQLAKQSKKIPKPEGKGALVPEGELQCDMCVNYEQQLVAEQTRAAAAVHDARAAQRALKIASSELEGARSSHSEAARWWRAERGATADALRALSQRAEELRAQLAQRTEEAEGAARAALRKVTALTVQRETLQETIDTLQKDNATLLGQYARKAIEIQNEDINLPSTVEELQEQCLLIREELILAVVGRERAAAAEEEARRQLLHQHHQHQDLADQHQDLARRYHDVSAQLEQLQTERAQLQELGDQLRQASDRVEGLLHDKNRLQSEVLELRGRISSLQQDLDTNEKVQQDFVRLSQSLQVELERIREAETEVRWQHEDDVTHCPACNTHLLTNKQKTHCRHCGRIFCGACASHSVSSGPRRRPARVCSVCRTLLTPHAAPYFSTDPPHARE